MTALAGEIGVEGFVKARPDSGFALFHPHDDAAGRDLAGRVDFDSLVFPRQVVRAGELLAGPARRRTASRRSSRPRASRGRGVSASCSSRRPDTNDGKSLASLIRPLAPHLGARARARRASRSTTPRPASGCTSSSSAAPPATWGVSASARARRWPMGIPRLRMPRGAPSRSTLKLAEAMAHFVGDEAAREADAARA